VSWGWGDLSWADYDGCGFRPELPLTSFIPIEWDEDEGMSWSRVEVD